MIEPRYRWVPPYQRTRGPEVLELAETCGLILDDWQQAVLIDACAVADDDRWVAFEVGLNVARQNGKNAVLSARELAGIFCFGERLIVHSAHLVDTSLEQQERLLELIEEGGLTGKIKRVVRTNGREAIQFTTGQRIRFRTRTKGGGRGFSGDCLVFDEAMEFPQKTLSALMPTMSARPNPQTWYAGSAVDQETMEHGVVWARVRNRGIAGGDANLVYYEWSAHHELAEVIADRTLLDDREQWRNANPAVGIRVAEDYIAKERRSMDFRGFAVERLGIGDWPPVDADEQVALDLDAWLALTDEESVIVDPICLTFDVTPDRSRTAIVATGRRADGLLGIEVVEHRRGTGWVPQRIADLTEAHEVVSVSCDARSPAVGLLRPLTELDVTVDTTTTGEYVEACGLFYDLVEQKELRHLGTLELVAAVKNAGTRPLGDAWAWSRKLSMADISPLVAATLGVWQASASLGSVYDDRGLVVL